jgi:aromatic-L-amino-acid/L-tryptophan decarboxylase
MGEEDRAPSEEPSLDPEDWESFARDAHRALDRCLAHLQKSRSRPAWREPPDRMKNVPPLPGAGTPRADLIREVEGEILPFATGNTHPRFWGWVHGTGNAAAFLGDLYASAMNSNCGGRDHAAVYVERAVIEWCRTIFGLPQEASGVLTTGTSMATLIALSVARLDALGPKVRADGLQGSTPLVAYASGEVHSAVVKALEVMGVGSRGLRKVTMDTSHRLDPASLRSALEEDRSRGLLPFCVIATAGSASIGAFDPLNEIADICEEQGLWFHVDGAFGAWARIAGAPWAGLVEGIERADSLAFDFHKWMYVQYDCGCALVRDGRLHRSTFAERPDYLVSSQAGVAGGEPWFCDYGLDLSRGFRALKVWLTLREYGLDRLGRNVAKNCAQAQLMAAEISRRPRLSLALEPQANICCFRFRPAGAPEELCDTLNQMIATELQKSGEAVFSTTRVGGRLMLRAAIVNHRTTAEDITGALDAVERTGARAARAL